MSAWPNIPLGELCDVTAGGTPSRSQAEYFGGKIPWVKIGDMLQGVVTSTEETITRIALEKSAAKLLPVGTVLISIFATIGRTAILGVEAATNQAIAGVVPHDPKKLRPTYLRHFLDHAAATLQQRSRGVAQANINSSILRALPIPLPSAEEQRRIADILDRAGALRAKRRAALAQLDTLTQSIFLDMFGDPKSSQWPTRSVAELAGDANGSIRTGPFGSQLLHSEFTDKGVAVLGIDNAVANEFRWGERRYVSEQKYQSLQRYTVYPGDVLITIMGTCGRCAVVPDDIPRAINTKHLCCITLDKSRCLPVFLHAYFLRHPRARLYLSQTSKGAIMEGLNMGIIKEMPVVVPPIQLQHEFQQRICSLRSVQALQMDSLDQLQGLFATLQQRAFRGEL